MQRLTEQQQRQAEERVELAKRQARRFRRPFWMSADEWEAEAMLVLVRAVATQERNANFEAHLYTLLRYRRLELNRRRPPMRRITEDAVAAPQEPTLDAALEGLSDVDGDMLRLRVMGSDWETLGVAYGCCGRTVRRWYNRVVEKLREEHAQ